MLPITRSWEVYLVQFIEQACIAFLHPEMVVHKQAGMDGWQSIEQQGKALSVRKSQVFGLLRSPFLTVSASAQLPRNLPSKEKLAPEDRTGKVRALYHIPYPGHLQPRCTQHAAAGLGRDGKLFPGGGKGVAITLESSFLPETAESKHPYIW
jgi:hypothetical protein